MLQDLLDHILPKHVAKEIGGSNDLEKMSEITMAKAISSQDSVTVLFCNIAGFNEIVSTHNPWELVTLLDSIYTAFDEIAEECGCEKIETVGEVYMAAAGLNAPDSSHHIACVNMAIKMLRVITQFRTQDERAIHLRLGVNTGSVMTGVVGTKRPQFSLFGDTVNTAARMQATGVVDRIQLSPTTIEHVSKLIELEARTVHPKGKPPMVCALVPMYAEVIPTILPSVSAGLEREITSMSSGSKSPMDVRKALMEDWAMRFGKVEEHELKKKTITSKTKSLAYGLVWASLGAVALGCLHVSSIAIDHETLSNHEKHDILYLILAHAGYAILCCVMLLAPWWIQCRHATHITTEHSNIESIVERTLFMTWYLYMCL